MKLVIKPYLSVGSLLFGESRISVRQQLGSDYKSFRKGTCDHTDTDAYDRLGYHLYYDDQDRLECIEFFEPANPVVNDIILLGRPLLDVVNDLTKSGYKAEKDDVGFDFRTLGVGLYVSDVDIERIEVEGVTVYRKGYYDD